LVSDYREIHTERLLMRPWRDSDRLPFAALNADPDVMRYFPAALDRAESDQLIDRIEGRFDQQGFGLWALEIRESGEFIGFTGLNLMPDGVPGAGDQEVGWRLDQRAWHKGYATEAARAALDVGLNRLGLPVIWSMTAVINQRSQAVMQRLGMVRQRLFDHPRIEIGHDLRAHVVYGIGQLPATSSTTFWQG
jgi:RimJ/RimL family protein N-acetyltransferase